MFKCEFLCTPNSTLHLFGEHLTVAVNTCKPLGADLVTKKVCVTMETTRKYILQKVQTNNIQNRDQVITILSSYTLHGPSAKLALVFPGAVTRSCLLLPRPELKMLEPSSWFCATFGNTSPNPFLVTTRFSLGGEEGGGVVKKWLF